MSYSSAVYSKTKSFIDLYGTGIATDIKGTGLYFPAVVAQAALESGYGSKIPADSYNFAGIKYSPNLEGVIGYVLAWTHEKINGSVQRVQAKFSKFKDAESGFKAHVAVLMKDRYTTARSATSPENQILGFAKAGYTSLSPTVYLNSMKSIIEAARDYSQAGKVS